jgi:ribosomal protein S12 methylthiotransferase accessory factor
MDIAITFPGGKRVDAHMGGFVIHTDQIAANGGDDTAPGPFDLFLASIATCAGYYALAFCQARQIPIDGLGVTQHVDYDATTHLPNRISLTVNPPEGFPERHRAGLLRAVENCKVKKTITLQPTFLVTLTDTEIPCAHA